MRTAGEEDGWVKLDRFASILKFSPQELFEVAKKFKIKCRYFDHDSYVLKMSCSSDELLENYYESISFHIRDINLFAQDKLINNMLENHGNSKVEGYADTSGIELWDHEETMIRVMFLAKAYELLTRDLDEAKTRIVSLSNEIKKKSDGPNRTTGPALVARKRKHSNVLIGKIKDSAGLACAITKEGQRRGLPWTEAEVLEKAKQLGLSLRGEALAAFKAGMPAELVKREKGARPKLTYKNISDNDGS